MDGEPPGGGRHQQDQGGSHGPHLHHRGHSKQNRTGEGILMSLIPLLATDLVVHHHIDLQGMGGNEVKNKDALA